jgi:transposase
MWVIPVLTPDFIRQMFSVLRLLSRPYDKKQPVLVLDEKPFFLRGQKRVPLRTSRGVVHRDYEYIRLGKANIFGIAEPKTGRNLTQVTTDRSRYAFGRQLMRIAKAYPKAKTIHLLVDNLNTHHPSALRSILPRAQADRLARRFKFHYTPKHASWLNPAEIVLSLISRETLGKHRFQSIEILRKQVNQWTRRADGRRKINWRFTIAKAKKKFRL